MSTPIITKWTSCEGCGDPIIFRDGYVVDVVYGGQYGEEIQIDTDVEHECQGERPDRAPADRRTKEDQ